MKRLVLWLTATLLFAFGTASAMAEDGPILMDFYASWCGPCKQMAPTVDALARDGYTIHRVDIDCDREMAQRFGVQAVPTFIVVERGKEIDRVTGATSRERLTMKMRKPAETPRNGTPTRAWKYAEPVGPKAAIVRIYCQENPGTVWKTRCIGSGTLVRWGGKIVVLTARHVVKDAKKIIVEVVTGKTYWGTVLKMDATWDCAVIELQGTPNVQPAEIEMGQAAMQTEGARLESCGYGPDGKLAVNSGTFLTYKRSSEVQNGPDDWMEISGYARQGDSGGPVFNERGRLVGVLWGTDGRVVVCVQSGRLHLLLNSAISKPTEQRARFLTTEESGPLPDGVRLFKFEQRAYIVPQSAGRLVPVVMPTAIQRSPTPPMPGPEPYQQPSDPSAGCGPGGCCPAAQQDAAKTGGGFALPYRNAEAAKEAAMAAQLDQVNRNLQAIQAQIAGQQQQQPQQVPQQPPVAIPPAPEKEKPGNAIEQKLDDFLHKLPIQGPITKLEEKQLESEHPLQRFFGATTAIVLLTTVGALLVIGLIMLGHKVYQAAHAHKADIEAKLGKVPVVGSQLSGIFDKLDTFNTANVDPKIQAVLDKANAAVADAKAKADAALHVATQAAVAVVPGAAPVNAALSALDAAKAASQPK